MLLRKPLLNIVPADRFIHSWRVVRVLGSEVKVTAAIETFLEATPELGGTLKVILKQVPGVRFHRRSETVATDVENLPLLGARATVQVGRVTREITIGLPAEILSDGPLPEASHNPSENIERVARLAQERGYVALLVTEKQGNAKAEAQLIGAVIAEVAEYASPPALKMSGRNQLLLFTPLAEAWLVQLAERFALPQSVALLPLHPAQKALEATLGNSPKLLANCSEELKDRAVAHYRHHFRCLE